MIRKLKIKFVLINMSLITVVLAITFAAVYASTEHRLVGETMSVLDRAISGQAYDQPGLKEIRPEDDPGPMRTPVFTVILDADNHIQKVEGLLFDLSDQQGLQEIVDRSLENINDSGIIEGASLRYLRQSTADGIKIAFADRNMELNTLAGLVTISLLVGAGSLLAFLLISIFLANWALRPVEEAWAKQQQFVADASHELKTPITVILANAGIVLSHQDQTVREQSKWVEYIQTEASRMSQLVENLLFLARTDEGGSKPVLSRLNISDTVWASILPFESVIFEQGKSLSSDIAPDLFINGDESKLRQLVGILLDNACKYSDEKGTIAVTLEASGDRKIKLSIRNTGGYIPADQLESIFERFVRVDKSRARQEGGYGLGLAIAQTIAEMHNSRIEVQSSPEAGTTFTVGFAAG